MTRKLDVSFDNLRKDNSNLSRFFKSTEDLKQFLVAKERKTNAVINEKVFISKPCHAFVNHRNVDSDNILFTLKFFKGTKEQKAWIDYLLSYNSPYYEVLKDTKITLFKEKKDNKNIYRALALENIGDKYVEHLMCFFIAVRYYFEFPDRLKEWYRLYKEKNFTRTEAFFITNNFIIKGDVASLSPNIYEHSPFNNKVSLLKLERKIPFSNGYSKYREGCSYSSLFSVLKNESNTILSLNSFKQSLSKNLTANKDKEKFSYSILSKITGRKYGNQSSSIKESDLKKYVNFTRNQEMESLKK